MSTIKINFMISFFQKNILILLSVFFYCANTCQAQERPSVAVSYGLAVPVLDFGSKNGDKLSAGYAKAGQLVALRIKVPLSSTSHYGLTLLGQYQQNACNGQAIADYYNQRQDAYHPYVSVPKLDDYKSGTMCI